MLYLSGYKSKFQAVDDKENGIAVNEADSFYRSRIFWLWSAILKKINSELFIENVGLSSYNGIGSVRETFPNVWILLMRSPRRSSEVGNTKTDGHEVAQLERNRTDLGATLTDGKITAPEIGHGLLEKFGDFHKKERWLVDGAVRARVNTSVGLLVARNITRERSINK